MVKATISILVLLCTFKSACSEELKCEPWQVYVKKHVVKPYVRKDGTKVRKAIRKAHCREKWKYADKWGPLFSDKKPAYWPNRREEFKRWTKNEKELVLIVFSEVSLIHGYEVNSILRAKKSKYKGNPASSIPETKDIVLYDIFFEFEDKKEILAHEVAHLIAHQVEETFLSTFAEKSGWKLEVRNRQIFEVAPKKLIKKDSSFNIEEDFCNYFEIYIASPDRVKKFNLQVYNFLKKRFPL